MQMRLFMCDRQLHICKQNACEIQRVKIIDDDTVDVITSRKIGSVGVLEGESPSLWMIA